METIQTILLCSICGAIMAVGASFVFKSARIRLKGERIEGVVTDEEYVPKAGDSGWQTYRYKASYTYGGRHYEDKKIRNSSDCTVGEPVVLYVFKDSPDKPYMAGHGIGFGIFLILFPAFFLLAHFTGLFEKTWTF